MVLILCDGLEKIFFKLKGDMTIFDTFVYDVIRDFYFANVFGLWSCYFKSISNKGIKENFTN
jgi:hypothetical protein